MTDESKRLHGVFKAIINGVNERGEGGVLFVKGDGCAYRFVSEFKNDEFRGALTTVIENDEDRHFFVVEERDKQLHVLAYPKTRVWCDLLKDTESNEKSVRCETRVTEIPPEDAHKDESCSGESSTDKSANSCA